MASRNKLILGLLLALVLVLISFCSIIIYAYSHPPAVKPLLEKVISRTTRTSVSIDTLSYSLHPLSFQARGIVLEPLENAGGFYLEIPTLKAEMTREGPFGQKSLVVQSLRIGGFSLKIFEHMQLPRFSTPAGRPSVVSRILKRLVAAILFREVRFQEVAVTEGNITAALRDHTVKLSSLRATIGADQLIEITGSGEVEWPAYEVSFTAPDLRITTDRVMAVSDPEIPFRLTITNAALRSQEAQATGMGLKARFNFRQSSGELLFAPVDLAVEQLILREQSGSESIPINLYLKATGRCDLKEKQLHASGFKLTLSDVADLQGALEAQLAPQVRIALELQDSKVFPQNLLRFVPDKVPEVLRPMTLAGAVGLQGEINGSSKDKQWNWHGDLQGRLAGNLLTYQTNEIRLRAKIAGQLGAVGTFPLLRVSGSLQADDTIFSGKSLELRPFKARLSLSGEYPVFLMDELTADIPRIDLSAGTRQIPIEDVTVTVRLGRLLANKKALFLPEVRFSSSLLKNLLCSLKADDKGLEIVVQGKEMNLIGSAQTLNLVPAGWQLGGVDTMQLRAVSLDQGDLSFACKLGFRQVRFQNKDGSSLGEDITLDTAMDGKYSPATSSVVATGSLKVDGGEVLLGPFYGDLRRHELSASVEARYDIPGKSLALTDVRMGLKDVVGLNIQGSLLHKDRTRRVRLTLDIPWAPMGPLLQQFLVEPLKTKMPYLANLNTGGAIGANINLTGTGNHWLAAGHLRWQDGLLSTDDQTLSLAGIDLDLPIWYQSDPQGGADNPLGGGLSIQSMQLPFVEKQPLAVKLQAEPNRLSVMSPTILAVPGGQVHIGPLFARDIFCARPTVMTSLALAGLDIKSFLGRIWSQAPEGVLSGKLDPVVFEGDSIKSEGELRLRGLNGEITLSRLGMSALFTPAPLAKLRVQLQGLSLGSLTTGTSFGKIEGVMQGHIDGLEIVNGQPQKFDLLLETVKTKGTRQMISLRAVDNIARIGGAQSPFMGMAKLVTAFFKHFPYRKIGVHATLKNDIFRINGTVREGEVEYLVRRGALWGVDVINQSTDNRASFKDMVKRIKRVTERSAGPVVK